ncbi:MAG TPA: alpha/beta hydrolase [Mycobacterium sp.]|nr:alpha/beta hydrolase [Mycobacterium sp.]
MISQEIADFVATNTPLEAGHLPALSDFPLWRIEFDQQMTALNPLAADIGFRRGEVGGVPGAWFEPPEGRRDVVLLYLHGGGLITSSPTGHSGMIGEVARATGRLTWAPNYRLAPEHPFPAQRDDVIACYRGLLEQGYSAEQIVVVGDSAGGGLAVGLAMAIRDGGLPQPLGVVGLSSWTDLAHTGESIRTVADSVCTVDVLKLMASYVAGNADLCDPRLSPLYGDFTGLPPMLLMAGELESLRDDTVRAGRLAERAGVEVNVAILPGLPHIWPWFVPSAPESAQAYRTIASYIFTLEARAGIR